MLTFKNGVYSIAIGSTLDLARQAKADMQSQNLENAQVCFNGVTVSIHSDSNIFDIAEKIHYRRNLKCQQ
jgi:hypothetical protein